MFQQTKYILLFHMHMVLSSLTKESIGKESIICGKKELTPQQQFFSMNYKQKKRKRKKKDVPIMEQVLVAFLSFSEAIQ